MIKKLHRFYTPHLPTGTTFTVTDTRIVHQASRVLALQTGESFILFSDNTDDIVVSIDAISKREISVHITQTIPHLPTPQTTLIAAVSIPKSDVFETIVQKLTEIGVSEIVPIRSQRTVKQSVRTERLQTISDEAVEQCGGNRRVKIHAPMDLADCLDQFRMQTIVFDIGGAPMPVPVSTCIMYIGPEGGWSPDDLSLFTNAMTVSLGPRVLRTDTAAIVGAFQILWASH